MISLRADIQTDFCLIRLAKAVYKFLMINAEINKNKNREDK